MHIQNKNPQTTDVQNNLKAQLS